MLESDEENSSIGCSKIFKMIEIQKIEGSNPYKLKTL